jgi:glycerophosphoryl diester phosphodiesterase
LSALNAPAWLTARPIAHRGLHAQGIVENSIAAAAAAIARNYAIECDVQCTKDGEAVVLHDFTLDRLTELKGDVGALSAAEVTRPAYRDGPGAIAALPDFLAAVGGRVPLIIEIKSRFDADMRLAARVASLAAAYSGPLAVQSFDPLVLAELRARDIDRPLGLVAQARIDESPAHRLDIESIGPDFVAWRAADLPHPVARISRAVMPVIAWTVRDAKSRAMALRWCDQVIFEGFEPAIATEIRR